MKCNNCGIELLGTMKKCPKCGFNTETGTVDSAYLENLNRSREKTPEPERYKKVISCEGRFSDDGGKGIRCEIQIADDKVLRVFKSQATGRSVSRAAFGMMGVLMYNANHAKDYDTALYEVMLDELISVERSKNPKFSKGWTIFAKEKKTIDIMLTDPVLRELRHYLGDRWK